MSSEDKRERELVRKRAPMQGNLTRFRKLIDTPDTPASRDVDHLKRRLQALERDMEAFTKVHDELEQLVSDEMFEFRLAERLDFNTIYDDTVRRARRLIYELSNPNIQTTTSIPCLPPPTVGQNTETRVDEKLADNREIYQLELEADIADILSSPSDETHTQEKTVSNSTIPITSSHIEIQIDPPKEPHKINLPATQLLTRDSSKGTVGVTPSQVTEPVEAGSFTKLPNILVKTHIQEETSSSPSINTTVTKYTESVIGPTEGTHHTKVVISEFPKQISSIGTVRKTPPQVVEPVESGLHANPSIMRPSIIYFQAHISKANTISTAKKNRQSLTFTRGHLHKTLDVKHNQTLLSMPDIASKVISTNSYAEECHVTSELTSISYVRSQVSSLHRRRYRNIRFLFSKRVRLKTHSHHIPVGLTGYARAVRTL